MSAVISLRSLRISRRFGGLSLRLETSPGYLRVLQVGHNRLQI